MLRLIGLDTEYGIAVEGARVADLVDEARAVVESWPGPWAGPWDYSREHPLRDLRGFRAEHLHTDPRDDRFERPSSQPLTRSEERADRVLPNGARLYQDHGHPEYATPECRSLFDLVAHDRAGERIVRRCARAYGEKTGKRVTLYKNNVDFGGMSYGAHENYLLRRDVPFEALQAALVPFLVTRILFAGTGKVGLEGTFRKAPAFQLAQRADFFTELASVDTLHRRPLLNTRDEPHADPARFRRLHVIAGDATLCEVATALRVGTLSLVLALLEGGWRFELALKDPLKAVKALSRDPKAELPLADGSKTRGPALQRRFLEACERELAGRDDETDWVLREWRAALDDLESDPLRLRDRVDWAAKRALVDDFLEAEGVSWKDADPDLLQSLDLAFHDLDPEAGLYQGLRAEGAVRTLVDEAHIEAALARGPRDTRAFLRGWCAEHLSEHIEAITWSRVVFRHEGRQVELDLSDCLGEKSANELNALAEQPGAVWDALREVAAGS